MTRLSTGNEPVDFTGQVVVVTGGGAGSGPAFCRELARRGAAVLVNDDGGSATSDRSADFADAVVRTIRDDGGTAVANHDTVSTEEGGQAIIDAALRSFGRVDAVIGNAASARIGRFGELTAEEIETVHAVHVKGAFYVCQPAYREMVRQGYGRIVLVSSQSGIFGNPFRSTLGAAATAMIGLMNVIAQEALAGIEVNCLIPAAPGGAASADGLDRSWLTEVGERVRSYTDGGRPEYVSAMACYLASRACDSSQNMFSVLGGKYSRVFVGLTRGWYVPGADAPTCEDIAAHLSRIDDRWGYDVPLSGLGEMDTVLAARKRFGLVNG